jgi:hypothetical protein
MEQFQTAFKKVMTGAVTARVGLPPAGTQRFDGIVIRA